MLDIKGFDKDSKEDVREALARLWKFLNENYWVELLTGGKLVPKSQKNTFSPSITVQGDLTVTDDTDMTGDLNVDGSVDLGGDPPVEIDTAAGITTMKCGPASVLPPGGWFVTSGQAGKCTHTIHAYFVGAGGNYGTSNIEIEADAATGTYEATVKLAGINTSQIDNTVLLLCTHTDTLMRMLYDGAIRLQFQPTVADGASARPHYVDTAVAYTTPGAHLFTYYNYGTQKLAVGKNGELIISQNAAPTTTTDTLYNESGTLKWAGTAVALINSNITGTAAGITGSTPVADGTYTVGARLTPAGNDGTITTVNGIITAVTQAT